jgi:hypothetical protein
MTPNSALQPSRRPVTRPASATYAPGRLAAELGRWASMTSVILIRSLVALALLTASTLALSTQFHGGPAIEVRHTFLLMHEGEKLPFTVEAKLTSDLHALAEMVVYAPWGTIDVPGKAFVGIPDPDLMTLSIALIGNTPARESMSVLIFYGPPDPQNDCIYEETRRFLLIEINGSKASQRSYLTIPDSREIEEEL